MSELRLHRGLYAPASVDASIAVYEAHARIERAQEGEYLVLHISSERPGRAERVAKELGNYALGLTIQARAAEAAATDREGAA